MKDSGQGLVGGPTIFPNIQAIPLNKRKQRKATSLIVDDK